MADYKHRREGTVQHFNSGDVVKEGFTVMGRRPRGAAPGNIVSEEVARSFEDRASLFDDIYDKAHNGRRRARLIRSTHDVFDDEPYLDYEG